MNMEFTDIFAGKAFGALKIKTKRLIKHRAIGPFEQAKRGFARLGNGPAIVSNPNRVRGPENRMIATPARPGAVAGA